MYLYLRHTPLWAPNTPILRITYCASPCTHKFLPRAHAACTYRPAPPRRAIKACADSGSPTVRSAADFVMVTYHSPLTLLRRWPCTPHLHPAQLVAGARDTVAGGTRRGTRVAAAPLCGNGAAYSVPSSILGAFSRPVPPPSTDDRRKDVRARAAAQQSVGEGRQLHGSTFNQMAIWVHDRILEMLNFHPPARSNRENRRAGTSRLVTRSTGIPTRPPDRTGILSQGRNAASADRLCDDSHLSTSR